MRYFLLLVKGFSSQLMMKFIEKPKQIWPKSVEPRDWVIWWHISNSQISPRSPPRTTSPSTDTQWRKVKQMWTMWPGSRFNVTRLNNVTTSLPTQTGLSGRRPSPAPAALMAVHCKVISTALHRLLGKSRPTLHLVTSNYIVDDCEGQGSTCT